MADPIARLREKDKRIDELIAQSEELVLGLTAIAEDMKGLLETAQGKVDQQKKISEKDRGQGD